MKKIKKLALLFLFFCAAVFSIGCSTDSADSLDELYGTQWVGRNPGNQPVAFEFGYSQTDPTDNATFEPTEGVVYITFSHDNTRQNYTYDYEFDETNDRYRWMIRNNADIDIIHFYIEDDDTLKVDKFYGHLAEGATYTYKKIGTTVDESFAAFNTSTATIWGGLNPRSRPMLYSFKTDGTVDVTFAFDGTKTTYKFTYNTGTGSITSQTGGANIGNFAVTNDKIIEFDSFYGHAAGIKIYRIKL